MDAHKKVSFCKKDQLTIFPPFSFTSVIFTVEVWEVLQAFPCYLDEQRLELMLCSCTSLQSHSHVTFAQVTKHPKQWAGGREIRGKCSNANYTTLVVVYRVCSSFCRPAATCWRWKHIHLFGACQYAWPVSLFLLYMTFVIVFSFLGCELLWRGSRIEHTGPGSEWHLQKLGPWSWVQSWCKHKTAVNCYTSYEPSELIFNRESLGDLPPIALYESFQEYGDLDLSCTTATSCDTEWRRTVEPPCLFGPSFTSFIHCGHFAGLHLCPKIFWEPRLPVPNLPKSQGGGVAGQFAGNLFNLGRLTFVAGSGIVSFQIKKTKMLQATVLSQSWQAPLYYNHFLNERPFYVRAIGIMRPELKGRLYISKLGALSAIKLYMRQYAYCIMHPLWDMERTRLHILHDTSLCLISQLHGKFHGQWM